MGPPDPVDLELIAHGFCADFTLIKMLRATSVLLGRPLTGDEARIFQSAFIAGWEARGRHERQRAAIVSRRGRKRTSEAAPAKVASALLASDHPLSLAKLAKTTTLGETRAKEGFHRLRKRYPLWFAHDKKGYAITLEGRNILPQILQPK